MPSVSHSVAFYVHTSEQQGFSAHGTATFETVAAVGHTAQTAVLETTALARGFQPLIGFVIVYEVFHLYVPFLFVGRRDAVATVRDSVQFHAVIHLPRHWYDAGGDVSLLSYAVCA